MLLEALIRTGFCFNPNRTVCILQSENSELELYNLIEEKLESISICLPMVEEAAEWIVLINT